MIDNLSIQDRIDIVRGKVESLVQTGIKPDDLIYCPSEWKDLTAHEFALLYKALPDMVLTEEASRYSGYIGIAGIHVTAQSAYNTRVRRPSISADELAALLTPAEG